MRKVFLTATIVMTMLFQTAQAANERDRVHQTCRALSNMGIIVMERRQAGEKMADMVEMIEAKDDKSARIIERIIIAAYEEDAHSSPRKKQQAVSDFENDVYKMCLKNF